MTSWFAEHRAAVRVGERDLAHDARPDLGQRHAHCAGLLLDERSCPGRAHVVHVDVHDPSLDQADELGVLAADLEDGFYVRIDRQGAGGMRADLVHDQVGADDGAHTSVRPDPVVLLP